MIYKPREKEPNIKIINDDFRNVIDDLQDVIVVTDPPFNVGYHYNTYKDRMKEEEYYDMLASIINSFPSVFIHYPESLYNVALKANKAPVKVCSWVYNSNLPRQHRDIAFWGISPDFTGAFQEYKNPNYKRIKQRIENGKIRGGMYDWWNVNQIKNVNNSKTKHPCQMPLDIMKNIISMLPADKTVFDPFTGSGTTAIACLDLGHDFIGTEIDPNYYQIAKDRIHNYKYIGDVVDDQIKGQMNIFDYLGT